MAILSNVRGRVESDPMGIPAPARMTTGSTESFETMLQQAEAATAAPRFEPAPAIDAEPIEAPAPVEDQAAEEQVDSTDAPAPGPVTDASATAPVAVPVTTNDDVTSTLRRGEPVRQESAGKGTDSPRTSSSPTESLLAAIVQRGAPANGPFVVGNAGANVPTITASRSVDATVRGVEATAAAKAAPARATSIAAGYRTNARTSAELVDHARDSVFKQILMKLTEGGGEMRVRLQPPELGELDLHMKVERGNQVSLWIGAERAEMADLLQKNLGELRHTLQAAGLEIADAQVGTRSGGGGFAARGEHTERDAAGDGAHEQDDTTQRRHGGWVTADGLDFWA